MKRLGMADSQLLALAHASALTRLSSQAQARHSCPSNSLPRNLLLRLLACRIPIAPGLSPLEFSRIHSSLALSFPPDLRSLLLHALPLAPGFPDWRSADLRQLRLMLHLPISGLSYEVARGRFWWKPWGPRPLDTEEAVNVARAALRKVPILIPVYRHYYIPASPNIAGNPVFSVRLKDVSYCGYDLGDFFERENFLWHDDYELPFDLANLGLLLGRTTTLGDSANRVNQTGRSFCLDNKLSPTDAKVETDARFLCALQTEERKEADECKEDTRLLEDWGRKLDTMAAQRNVTSVRINEERSVEVFNRQVSRYCDQSFGSSLKFDPICPAQRQLSNNRHSDKRVLFGAVVAPRAKLRRRIEFWSDLAESFENMGVDKDLSEDDDLFSCVKVDVDVEQAACPVLKQLASLHENRIKQPPTSNNWVDRYLDGMAITLRKGGWQEADIAEMMSAAAEYSNAWLDRYTILEGLVLYLKLLLDALMKAGWSSSEVADSLDMDLSFLQITSRRPLKLPPHVAASIRKLVT